MLLVIPFSASDKNLAPTVQEAFQAFPPGADHELLVIAYPNVRDEAVVFQQSLSKYFRNTFLHVLHGDNQYGWPYAMNELFQAAALKAQHLLAQGGCWLWFEMDSTPTQPNWLTTLQTAYFADSLAAQREGRQMKRFMGVRERALRTFNGELVAAEQAGTIMAAVGVYPPDFATSASAIIKVIPTGNLPFYLSLQWYTAKSLQETPLIQNNKDTLNYRKEEGKIVSDSRANNPWNIHWNNPVRDEAILIHGCKDGSLLATILEKVEPVKEAQPEFAPNPVVLPVSAPVQEATIPRSYRKNRRKSAWTPERRAAQAEKMRAIQQARQQTSEPVAV